MTKLVGVSCQIDTNGGGQILFSEFVDWALEKNLDLEDDVDSQVIQVVDDGKQIPILFC
jgi:hypothetical protein